MSEAKSPVVRLKVAAKELNFSKLRADQANKLANSGETMFLDFQRMNFVINGKEIDKNFIIAFKEGAKRCKSELFNSDDIYSDEIFNDREIDTDHGKAFVDSVLKSLEKELMNDELVKLWNNHCGDPEIADHQKTDSYKKNYEAFYNAGQSYTHLLPIEKDENKDYRPLTKEIFKQIFRYIETEVPSNAILEELVTNCNQAGYEAAPFVRTQLALGQSFVLESPQKVMNIDCINQNSVRIRSNMSIPVLSLRDQVINGNKICTLSNALEFTIESCNGESFVTYRDGKLLLTIPEGLKNYKDNGKSLFDIIKEYFQKLCIKLGFKPETETQIEHDLGTSMLDGAISTIGSDANKEFINLLEKNLKDELSKTGADEEDVDAYVEVKVPTVIDLLSNYIKLEDNQENKELLVKEVADNLGLSSQNYTFYSNGNPFALRSLPYLIKGQVDCEQARFVANIFTKLIIEGKSKVQKKQGAIDAINQKIDGKIIEQEEKMISKKDIENDQWTDKIEKQRLSVKSHEHPLQKYR